MNNNNVSDQLEPKGDKLKPNRVIEIGKISGVLGLDKRKHNGAKFPLQLRLSFENKRLLLTIGKTELSEKEFKLLSRNQGDKELRLNVKAEIAVIESAIKELYRDGNYSHEELRKKLRGGRWIFVKDAFDAKIKELENEGRVGTLSSYISCRNFFQNYSSSLTFADITPDWLMRFEKESLKKVSQTSVSIYLRYLRHLINRAIKKGDFPRSKNPFDTKESEGFKIKKTHGTKIYLSIEQLNQLASLKLKTIPLERARDLFMLSFYLGGIGIYDLLQLKWENIRYDDEGDEISYLRQKTGIKVTIPIWEQAWDIFKRWGTITDKKGYIFPFVNPKHTPAQRRDYVKKFTQRMNKQLKIIGEIIGADNLSSYVARHSAATFLMNNESSVRFIQSMMGHTSPKTTENYLHDLNAVQRRKQAAALASIGKKGGEVVQLTNIG